MRGARFFLACLLGGSLVAQDDELRTALAKIANGDGVEIRKLRKWLTAGDAGQQARRLRALKDAKLPARFADALLRQALAFKSPFEKDARALIACLDADAGRAVARLGVLLRPLTIPKNLPWPLPPDIAPIEGRPPRRFFFSAYVRQLEDPDVEVRRRALAEVARTRTFSRGVEPRVIRCLRDEDAQVRQLALRFMAYATNRTPACRAAVVSILENPQATNDDLALAARAIKYFPTPPASSKAERVARREKVARLIRRLLRTKRPVLQAAALNSLPYLVRPSPESPRDLAPFAKSKSVEVRRALFLGSSNWMRDAAFRESFEPIVRLALEDQEPSVVCTAAVAFFVLNPEDCAPTLLKLSEHADPRVRSVVAHGLGRLRAVRPDSRITLRLLALAHDAEVRRHAITALGIPR